MYSFVHGFLLLFARLMPIVGIEHFCYLKKLPGTLLSVEPLLPQPQGSACPSCRHPWHLRLLKPYPSCRPWLQHTPGTLQTFTE